LRTAEGAGVRGVLLSARDSCGWTATVSKVSAGADAHLKLARADRLEKALETVKDQGVQLVTTVPGAEMPYYAVDFRRPTVIVLGGEGEGLNPRQIRQATHLVSIPMLGKVASLNVAAAAAVLLYEAVRQRTSPR
jgi:23S rRNA (guanosine2251-2'-O)-methyltransferase